MRVKMYHIIGQTIIAHTEASFVHLSQEHYGISHEVVTDNNELIMFLKCERCRAST